MTSALPTRTSSMAPPTFAATVAGALRALEAAATIREVMDFRNQAEALRILAARSRYGLEMQNACAALRLRAERRMGVFLRDMDRQRSGRPKMVAPRDYFRPRLADLGISKSMSQRAQRLADIPTAIFDHYIRDTTNQKHELTARGLWLFAERLVMRTRNKQKIVGGRVDDLLEFAGRTKVGTILLDPPWSLEGVTPPYEMIGPDELRALPIPDLAAARSHLHMWTLPNWTLWAAKEVIEYWGFRVVGIMTWGKTGALGTGNYWRWQSEHLISAVRSRNDHFDDRSWPSYREAPREAHSRKPDVFFTMLEAVSPPPRLELYARTPDRAGWHVWGHEIATRLVDRDHKTIVANRLTTITPMTVGGTIQPAADGQ
jgi:N6-adenosine-specific RNA methylase IME4